jgi:hypothetical protein
MKIPKSLFESIQASLNQEAKRLCRDAAKILKVSEKELQDKILKKMPKIEIHDDNEMPYSCPVLTENNIIERCRKPCLLGTGRCYTHQVSTIPEHTSQIILTRLHLVNSSSEPLWCNEIDGNVYDKTSSIVGHYINNRLTLYKFSE